MNLHPIAKKLALTAAALTACITAPLVARTADDYTLPVVKRYFMVQADARCHLLDGPTSQALKAGYLQARNDALRAGLSMAYLAPWLEKAKTAAHQSDCTAPSLIAEVTTAEGGFRRFIAVPHLQLSSGRTEWLANRTYGDDQIWRLVQYQNTDQADMAFGLYGGLHQNSFSLMTHFKNGARPYSARLLVRNTDIVATGVINRAPYGLSETMPAGFSDYSSLSFMAHGISDVTADLHPGMKTNLAGFTLTGNYVGTQGPEAAMRFDFPSRAWMAIARLDPREDIVVEFNSEDGPRYARFEVGDFITGLSYVALPAPYTHNQVNTQS
ncbi:hypothetical protein [Asticcacaulis sp.]|uniref:hypothetical protein n=1 Tax=Asticcacaulis sp. TaxID=1872648 RepID=UPI002CAE42FD|nr:hypothetical protein [Asticcacaulis sp.]HTM80845.1 hypothetical protein [Asticcacaulis sp.]